MYRQIILRPLLSSFGLSPHRGTHGLERAWLSDGQSASPRAVYSEISPVLVVTGLHPPGDDPVE